jgi:hypothetical protein
MVPDHFGPIKVPFTTTYWKAWSHVHLHPYPFLL